MKTLFPYAATFAAVLAIQQLVCTADQAMSAAESTETTLDVQYARAKLELAQAKLKKVAEMNRRVARAVSPNVVAEYESDVALAKRRLENAESGKSDMYALWLEEADANYRSARAAWKSAVAANSQQLSTVDRLNVERLRLQAEVLKIGLERGQALANQPREAQLAWRLDVLNDEMQRLSEAVFRGTPASGRSSIWLYDDGHYAR